MERHLDGLPSRQSLRLVVNWPAAGILGVKYGTASK
jgi:hypothetical protein